ncbi:GIY-YIG nuclease family protein [Brevibacillus daliensis]|uniref:GIY-YIG nuclease family protein n=1 Tax=Brevibacillus daliensis TaxID=2892995 RepID=UPI001E3BAF39|nr:GIY-YIG nuclease family protein [Brevibacillus daliensis]
MTNNRKERILQYKEEKIYAGVYQIKNTRNEKIYIGSTPNVKTLNGQLFSLKHGSHVNRDLQEEWNQYGEDVFVIEVLEQMEKNADNQGQIKKKLENLEKKWIENTKPHSTHVLNKIFD